MTVHIGRKYYYYIIMYTCSTYIIFIGYDISRAGKRRKLVSELRQKIASEPLQKWVIKFGKIESVGDFTK